MSLFPAYENTYSKDDVISELENATTQLGPINDSDPTAWLKNASFAPPGASAQSDEPIIIDDDQNHQTERSEDDEIQIVDVKIDQKSKEKEKEAKKKKKKAKKRRKREESREKSEETGKRPKIDRKGIGSVLLSKRDKFRQEIFAYDFKKDLENLQFGFSNKRQVAEFKCKINRCLGGSEKIDNLLNYNKKISENDVKFRYFGKKLKKFDLHPKQILQKTEKNNLGDFIPLSETELIDNVEYKFDETIQMYRPVIKNEDGNDNDENVSSKNGGIYNENCIFNKLISSNSTDIRLWKQFLTHQDSMYQSFLNQEEFKCTKSALVERKLAILDKALEKNPSALELKLMRLDFGAEFDWTTEKLKEEWRKIEFLHINQPEMWKNRLKFSHFQFSYFTISKQIQLFLTCFEKLSAVLSRQLMTHQPVPGTERFLVTCFSALVDVWLQGGHSEKALALCQALIEFNFRQPNLVERLRLEEKRQFFEPFWDSGAPRIGEANSSGWSDVLNSKPDFALLDDSASAEFEAKQENQVLSDLSKNESVSWIEIERHRSTWHWLPLKNTVSEPEDPERIVLFDDVERCLYDINDSLNKFLLVIDIFSSIGFNFAPFHSSNDQNRHWFSRNDENVALLEFECLPKLRSRDFRGMDEFVNNVFDILPTLFLNENDHNVKKSYITYSRIYDVYFRLVDDVIQVLLVKEKVKKFKNTVKQILMDTENRNDLLLYVAYAQGMSKFGQFEEALKICELALSNYKKAAFSHQKSTADDVIPDSDDVIYTSDDVILLLSMNFYVNLYLRAKNWDDRTLSHLQTILANFLYSGSFILSRDATFVSSVDILKAKKMFLEYYLELKSNFSLSNNFIITWLGNCLTLFSNLYAIFLYCSARNLTQCSEIYEESRDFLRNRLKNQDIDDNFLNVDACIERDVEKLYENEVFLFNGHVTYFGGSPKLLTAKIEQALYQFPNNVNFLKSYCDNNLRGFLITGLRRFFNHKNPLEGQNGQNNGQNPPEKGSIWWLAAVYAEFSRYLKLKEDENVDNPSRDIHSIRQTLEKSVENCPRSILLWRLYMKMESLWFSNQSENVQKIFYRAIKQCPGAKNLYLDAIQLLPPDQTRTIIDLMVEKEIRVRLPWEEFNLLWKNVRKTEISLSFPQDRA